MKIPKGKMYLQVSRQIGLINHSSLEAMEGFIMSAQGTLRAQN